MVFFLGVITGIVLTAFVMKLWADMKAADALRAEPILSQNRDNSKQLTDPMAEAKAAIAAHEANRSREIARDLTAALNAPPASPISEKAKPKKASELARPVRDPEWRPRSNKSSTDPRWFEGEAGERATFEYVDADGVVSEREIRNWDSKGIYINGYCLLRRRVRTFRKDRIENWDAS